LKEAEVEELKAKQAEALIVQPVAEMNLMNEVECVFTDLIFKDLFRMMRAGDLILLRS